MEIIQNKTSYTLGDSKNKNSFARLYTYEMQHSSLFIANKLSTSFSKIYENRIKELNNTIKNLKTELEKKEEEIKNLKNNLSNESLISKFKNINNFLKINEQIELKEKEKAFLKNMNKKNNRISKLNEKMKDLREKEKSNKIDLIEDNSKENGQELKEEIKIKPSKISKEDKDKIQNFRIEFELKEEDFSDKKIFDALKINNYDFENAFASFFHD